MLNDSKSYSFRPNTRKAYRTNILTGLLVAILLPITLWLLRGEDSPLVLAIFGIVFGIIAFVAYSWRNLKVGLQSVEITHDTLTISGKKGFQTIRWQNIRGAKHKTWGGEKWIFELNERHEPVTFFVEGYSLDEEDEIKYLIGKRLDAHRIPIE